MTSILFRALIRLFLFRQISISVFLPAWGALGGLMTLLLAPVAVMAESLDVLYFEYPPYYHQLPDGQPSGLIVDLARRVFDRAGIEARFEFIPAKRILYDIQKGRPVASLGWFKTSEREEFARFSLPIYVNRPVGVLVPRERGGRFQSYDTLEALMASREFFLGRVGGFSDGAYLDSLLARYPDRVVEVPADSVRLLKMLQADRFDFVLIPPEEMEDLLREARMSSADFSLRAMRDIPGGNTRYIMYSKAVDQNLIRRVDDAIAAEIGCLRPGS